MGKQIPDRWLDYQPIGQRVPSTRFIAFKVPLRQNINETVNEEQRLAPHSLLESVPNLGLIVDLTNTDRYYNPQSFTEQNVKHQKLMIPGHQTPPRELAQRFCDYVTNFLDANADNDKLIGVHCTHGVNRTGYLICYFMITKMNMPPKLAIQTFADARGHKIERQNYTSSLLNLDGVEKSNKEWPRPFQKFQDDQRDERREGNWRHDASSWQRQQQDSDSHRHRQDRAERPPARYQDRNCGHDERRERQPPRYYGHDDRRERQPQQNWRGNGTRRYEPYERTNAYNSTFYQKQDNRQMQHQPRGHRGNRQNNDYDLQSYSRFNNNNYNNHSRNNNNNNNNYGNSNYSRYKYNRQDSRNNHYRFNAEE